MDKKQKMTYGMLTALSVLLFVGFAFSAISNRYEFIRTPVITALAVKKKPAYGQYVTLEGLIVQEPQRMRYTFSDKSGSILVEIRAHSFRNQRVTDKTPIQLMGTVEADSKENTKISVKHLSVVHHKN